VPTPACEACGAEANHGPSVDLAPVPRRTPPELLHPFVSEQVWGHGQPNSSTFYEVQVW
jgi:hypothetical protein